MTPVANPAAPPIIISTKDGLFCIRREIRSKERFERLQSLYLCLRHGDFDRIRLFSCAKAVGRAALSTWNNGIKTTLRSIGSSLSDSPVLDEPSTPSSIGLKRNGISTVSWLKRKTNETLQSGSAKRRLMLFNGTCRLIAVGGGTIAYTFGTVKQSYSISYAEPDSLHQAAKSIASGFNTIASYMPSAAWNVAKTPCTFPAQAGSAIRENPEICAKGVLLSATIYMATSHLTKAIDKPGFLTKLYHTACAITGLALTVAIAQAQFSSQLAFYTLQLTRKN